MTFLIVLLGWVFSLCLHEFLHALAAYLGGDTTVKDKGYLTFNPLKYTHPVYSLLLPMLFLLMGGIGLPGGAVYIERWRLKNRNWETLVSLAGPSANLLLAVVLGLFFNMTAIGDSAFGPALAFLGFLQVSAVVLNLIPLPPFDGFGAIEPYLPMETRSKLAQTQGMFAWVVLLLLWQVPFIGGAFWRLVGLLARAAGIPLQLAALGMAQFRLW